MWVDDEDVIHTVAVADPELILGLECVHFLEQMSAADGESLEKDLENLHDRFFTRFEESGITDRGIEVSAPPHPLFGGQVHSIPELLIALSEIQPLWQLEAIQSCQDVLDRKVD